MVEECLISLSPFRCGACRPGAIVGGYPLAMFVVVSFSWFFRTPVHFSDDDRSRVDHRHLLTELTDVVLFVATVVTASEPARIVVNGIADVIALNGMGGIAGVVGLPSGSRSPDDTCEAVGTYLVDDGLEVVVKGCRIIFSIAVLQ